MNNLKHIGFETLPILMVFLLGYGCQTVHNAAKPQPITQQPDTNLLPTFSPEVLYVLGYEWELIHDSTSAKFDTPYAQQVRDSELSMDEYLENRLIELYPQRAYSGYVNKVEKICEMLLQQAYNRTSIPNNILAELPLWRSDNAATAHNSMLHSSASDSTILSENEIMQFTPKEFVQWSTLNQIAEQSTFADRQTFDTLQLSTLEEENLLLSILLWRGPRIFYRVIQSKTRAENVAKYYYGEETHSGKLGDAFKHIYVNVLLRTYTSAPMAWLVMDLYWENAHPNAPCDHFMDLHNNVVGRTTFYPLFVQADNEQQCGEARPWLLWAEQVQRFVQDTTINSAYQQWNKETPLFIVEPAANAVTTTKYIYWDK